MKGISIDPIPSERVPASNKTGSFWQQEIAFGARWPLKERQRFYQMLSILLEASLTLPESLEVLSAQTSHKESRRLGAELKEALEKGSSLQEAVLAQGAAFRLYEIQSLKMGEETGRMGWVTGQLAAYFEHRLQLRRKISQALVYPISVVLVASGVLAFMLLKVVPMFAGIFAQFDAALPPLTQTLLGFSAAFQRNWGWILLGNFGMLGVLLGMRNLPYFQKLLGKLQLALPFLGPLLLKLHLSRVCFSLSQMLQSGITLDQALAIQSDMMPLYPLTSALGAVREALIQGRTLHEAVQDQTIFPRSFVQFVKVGERSARLAMMLEKMGDNMEEEASASIDQLTSLLEPVLIIVLGGMVAVILIAMYLPMFELSTAF